MMIASSWRSGDEGATSKVSSYVFSKSAYRSMRNKFFSPIAAVPTSIKHCLSLPPSFMLQGVTRGTNIYRQELELKLGCKSPPPLLPTRLERFRLGCERDLLGTGPSRSEGRQCRLPGRSDAHKMKKMVKSQSRCRNMTKEMKAGVA